MRIRNWLLALISFSFLANTSLLGYMSITLQDGSEGKIAALEGRWRITYTNDATRTYVIEKNGDLSFIDEDLKGKIEFKDGILQLTFPADERPIMERLTLGTDGRLFVEHYNPKADYPKKKPKFIGIGVRKNSTTIQLDKLGTQQSILKPGAFGLSYFPDQCICLLNSSPLVFTIVCGKDTFLFSGQSWSNVQPVGKVLQPTTKSYDNGYAGIGGLHRNSRNGSLVAFYHAEDHNDVPRIEYNNVPGFYASICLAISKDQGRSFSKGGQIITCSQPKNKKGNPAQGVGDVTVTPSDDGKYLYAYYSDHSRVNGRGVQICLARSKIEDNGKPGSWKKFHDGNFNEPGIGGKDTPVVSMKSRGGDAWCPHVIYLKHCGTFLMTFSVTNYTDLNQKRATNSGIFMAYSDDGIKWSEPQKLISAITVPMPGLAIAMHSTLIITKVGDSKINGTLLYGYSPSWGDGPGKMPHYLAGNPITLKLTTSK